MRGPTLRAVTLCAATAALVVAVGAAGAGSPPRITWEPHRIEVGDAARIVVRGATQVRGTWDGRPLTFVAGPDAREQYALIGVDLATGAREVPLRLSADGAPPVTIAVPVVTKVFPTERLVLSPNHVDLSPADAARADEERDRLEQAFARSHTDPRWRGRFVPPVPGDMTGPFGRRRIINGQPRSPHLGVDLRAAEGEAVVAANAGVVTLVGDFFFMGWTIVLDHGLGLTTYYAHLSRVDVATHQRVARGERLGLAGMSGRATGPHLHWGARIQGARVDPLTLLRLGLPED